MVDSLGLLLKVVVSQANAPERVFGAYALMESIEEAHVEVIRRTNKKFQVLPKRWVVERTFGSFNQSHRLSKDYERLPEMSEAAIYSVMTRIMLRRFVS